MPDAPKVAIPTVFGLPTMETAAGVLEFELAGRPYRLQALAGDAGDLFLLSADATSGITTYGAGRFLWANAPDAEGSHRPRLQPRLQTTMRLHTVRHLSAAAARKSARRDGDGG